MGLGKTLQVLAILLDYKQNNEEKLQMQNHFLTNTVGYVYDKENDILKKGSKDSPSDCSKEDFLKLIRKHVVWL